MAELLYRLGRFAARRAWLVVSAWLVVLVAVGAAFATFGGTLSTAITIPGTPTAEVTDRLQAEFPDAAGGTGTVVLHTADGSPFTDAQRDALTGVFAEVSDVEGVSTVVDPFAVTAQLADQEKQIADGRAQIAAGREQIDAGRQQLEGARAQLDAGQAELDAARSQAETAGMLAQAQPQLDAQQAQLDAGRTELEKQSAELEAQSEELEAGSTKLELGAEQLAMAGGIRTVSEDGSAATVTVQFTDPTYEVPTETKQGVEAAFEDNPVDGVDVDYSAEITQSIDSIAGAAELIGLGVAVVVLIVMLGTLVAAGLPILSALIGVGVGALGALALSGTIEMLSVTPVLGLMLGLAVGIDYSLFILNRHRRQLREGMELHESIGLATGTSGNAVVFAGLTVLIALLALNVTGIGFLGLMGTVAAACVAIAVLVAVTLMPALLRLVGHRVLPRRLRGRTVRPHERKPARAMSTGAAVLSIVTGVAALVVVALPALDMRLGLPDGSSEPQDSTQYRAYSVIEDKFGAGQNGPLLVVAELPAGTEEADVQAIQVAVGRQIMGLDDVVAVAPVGTSEDLALAAFQVVPAEGPSTESTEQLVHELRDLRVDGEPDVDLAVAGAASGNIDISEKLSNALPAYLGLVIGLSLIILVLVFRSILVPVIATGGFILSVFAAFGGVTAIYQWGWLGEVFGVHTPGPVLNFLPTILIGVLFGLAMDYQLFLVSGMREAYVHGTPAREAVIEGRRAGRAVVTAAAIIMISVFGGFMFSHMAMIRPIGFGLAFGVLVDAFLVRMLLVPALMHLAGDKAWWLPRWLDRLLPNVDVEGAALERRHHHEPEIEPAGSAVGS
ncbi:RND superfamily putative drug exporter [Georgenia soli]|uniref:RND superfamily putative drug exporter n=1 Tax=Georgenia soli TaxID=638953 RepID=A0A2A9ERY6_9MICO|nr:MMPL family transporter [Georgenia soli]PFG41005.1 RND superfamily putative drug exporter [Georgenia soli]